MRGLGAIPTVLVVLFWLFMNGLLVHRQIEYRSLGQYRRGVMDFLGNRISRERWMGIYRKDKRIGRTGFAIERRLGDAAPSGYQIRFATRLDIDLFDQGGATFGLSGSANLDLEMAPLDLKAEVVLGQTRIGLSGRRDGGQFLVQLSGGEHAFEQRLPLQDLYFGDGLAPVPPSAGLQVGETYRVVVFDPLFRKREESETRVAAETRREVDGVPVDCLELETRFRGMVFRSFMTRDGEVLRQELPPPLGVVLIRETPGPGDGRP